MSSPPSFLSPLFSSSPSPIPIYPLPHFSHSKPTFPELTSPIASSSFHPALEAALHLANGDLYSAHFLVRKGQGGRRELDWGHGLLHRLEGDWGNAKTFWTSSPSGSGSGSGSGDSTMPTLSSKLSHPSQYLDLLLLLLLLLPSAAPRSATCLPC
ncbi:hypothetical protein BCV69DRAFT_87258 [Microstroma glucosiphilum]|uniref:Uncharacterized protein n=1 Tax=Pseudomicrostroma glucosiphilum TaxID=1684307 RepID=A0A316TXT3_9BASI|nr:hypothetical protein BCV69DRAFT_87258 [Pseudomicrostroma glucosiphilum]PWN18169.1 hypothetical protein BCV69DRAFT_87258 [Pseudomicrostroma glucosiphilum]